MIMSKTLSIFSKTLNHDNCCNIITALRQRTSSDKRASLMALALQSIHPVIKPHSLNNRATVTQKELAELRKALYPPRTQ